MSIPEHDADVIACPPRPSPVSSEVEVIAPRDVPLGGLRAMTVRRTLPSRQRSLIGAWCFVDHFGPDQISETGGMTVAPHPHIGLQTVSWLFEGQVEHRDSAGNHAMVLPGEVNLMTAGQGISHSEISLAADGILHGAQLWVALPDHARHVEPHFVNYRPEPVAGDGWKLNVFLGSLAGSSSPVETYTPLLGSELSIEPETEVVLALDPLFEHGLLIDSGEVAIRATYADQAGVVEQAEGVVRGDELGYLAPGAETISIRAGAGGARLLILGGPPFGEEILMWWNFVGRTHDEIIEAREEWLDAVSERETGELVASGQEVNPTRFGVVVGQELPPIRPPEMPRTKLRSRR